MRATKILIFCLTVFSFLILVPYLTIADPLDNWHKRNSSFGKDLYGIAYGNNTFVAVGDSGTIRISSDGVTWTTKASGTSTGLTAVVYGNNTFVTVGNHGTILISPDGETWTPRTAYSGTTNDLTGIAYGNGTFVAVGLNRTALTSTDGVGWTARNPLPFPYNASSVTYGNGVFVAVGECAEIYTSTDGIAWTERMPVTCTFPFWDVTYGKGTFVAVGWGEVFTSPSGITWAERNAGTSEVLEGVAYGNNSFVAVGGDNTAIIFTSPDGIAWAERTLGIYIYRLNGVAYGNGTFAAVGGGGDILQSDSTDTAGPTLSITSHTNNQDVSTTSITLSGTASDSGKGDNGIQQVTINGGRANNDTATGNGVANWSKIVSLSPGANILTVVAYDNTSSHNQTSQTITIFYDLINTVYVSKDGVCNGHSHCWPNIQNGISQASGPSIIEITQSTYNENIVLDVSKKIILEGGWDMNFTSSSSYTTINGSITITNGTMIVEYIILE